MTPTPATIAAERQEGRPLLGLLAAPGTPNAARALVRALARHVDITALDARTGRPAATGTTGAPAARAVRAVLVLDPDRLDAVGDLGVPVAVWLDRPAEGSALPAAVVPVGPGVGAGAGADAGPGAGASGVRTPAVALDLPDLAPLGPLVRRRWRQRAGLPEPWTADLAGVAPPDRLTALAVCTVAVVRDAADLAAGLALGTPCVATAGTLRPLLPSGGEGVADPRGTRDDPPAVVVDDAVLTGAALEQALAAEATALARDERRAAALGRAARAHAAAHLDMARAADRLRGHLGLVPADQAVTVTSVATASGPGSGRGPVSLADRLDRRLDELETPAVARIRTRVATALVPGGQR
ncbi:MAG: hypothetical protein HYX34_05930 [Actinobacteria bacterium]|nr:hypothetical protein [Actinomycetota bacterium]